VQGGPVKICGVVFIKINLAQEISMACHNSIWAFDFPHAEIIMFKYEQLSDK
jgi:hypothetical protein